MVDGGASFDCGGGNGGNGGGGGNTCEHLFSLVMTPRDILDIWVRKTFW